MFCLSRAKKSKSATDVHVDSEENVQEILMDPSSYIEPAKPEFQMRDSLFV